MPYDQFGGENPRKKKQPGQVQAMPRQQAQPSLASATARGPSAPAPAATSGGQQQAVGAPSGQHVNFDQYMRANQGAAQNTAGQMAAGVAQQGNAALQGLAQQQAAFQAQMGEAQRSGAAAYGGPAGLFDTRGAAQPGTGGTQAMAPRGGGQASMLPGNVSSLGAQDYGRLRADALDAERAANATATSGGIEAMLRQGAGGGYSTGQSAFDAALVGTAGRQDFNALRAKYGGILGQFGDAERYAADAAGAARSSYTPAALDTRSNEDRAGDETEQYVRESADAQIADPEKLQRFKEGRPTDAEYDEYIGWMQGQF